MFSLFDRFRNPRKALIEQLLEDPSPRVRHALLRNPNLPDALRRKLQDDEEAVSFDPYSFIETQSDDFEEGFIEGQYKQALAQEPDTPLEVLLRLTADADNYTAGLAVQHPAMPVEKLHAFARNPDFAMFVVSHPHCPREYLEKFSRHSDGGLRATLAERPGVPATILERLAGGYEQGVREGVATNPGAPAALLIRLARDPNDYVRKAVAANPSAPPDALALLAEDSETFIRSEVADNPATPLTVLMALFETMERYTRPRPVDEEDDGVLEEFTDEDSGFDTWNSLYICRRIAAHPAIPVSRLREWFTKDEGSLLRGLAHNPNAPADLLLEIAKREFLKYEADEETLGGLAGNPAATGEVLSLLAGHRDSGIRRALAGHANTPVTVLAGLAGDEDEEVRQKLAERGSLPPEVLELLAADENDRVRWRVAGHSGTPLKALKQLAEDEEDEIRANVARNIRLDA